MSGSRLCAIVFVVIRLMPPSSLLRPDPRLAWRALRSWGRRQVSVAIVSTVVVAVVVGVPTVLIPNPLFGREIPPTWWSYPVWILTSVLSGMLLGTYLRTDAPATSTDSSDGRRDEDRTNRFGVTGTVLAWFAVGCPVCNKFALLALGYGGAMTWFAPVQPVLALAALATTGLALMARLRGQIACPMPTASRTRLS